jgi:integrase
MPGLVVRVNPTGSKTYMVRYDRSKAITLGDCSVWTLAQARDAAKEIMHKASTGADPVADKRRSKSTEFVNYIEETYKPYAIANLRDGAYATKILLAIWSPIFGGKSLDEITAQAVDKARNRWRMDGLSPSSCNRYVIRLGGLLSLALRYGDIKSHPLKGMKQFQSDSTRVRYLSPQEEQSLRQALDDRQAEMMQRRHAYNKWRIARSIPALPTRQETFTDYLKPLVLLAMNTGMRRGELLSLTWSDINLDERLITVQASKTKTGKRRHIPLSDEALWIIEELQKTAHGTYVFNDQGKRLSSITKPWLALIDRAGIDNFHFHDLRHHFASRLVQAGADLNTVRELLGHSDLKMTLRYAHLAPHNKRRVMDLLNKPREDAGDNILQFKR